MPQRPALPGSPPSAWTGCPPGSAPLLAPGWPLPPRFPPLGPPDPPLGDSRRGHPAWCDEEIL
eukprot:3571492-Alexandrium_andersonii.AAC.1